MEVRSGRFRVSERAIYGVMGWVCGMALGLLLYFIWKASEFLLTFPPLAGMVLALCYSESTGRIPTVEEVRRPISLFPKDRSTKET
jgi:hypothetical protein